MFEYNPYKNVNINEVRRIKVVTDLWVYGPCPKKDDILKQEITFYLDGRIKCKNFTYDKDDSEYHYANTETYEINQESFKDMAFRLDDCFKNNKLIYEIIIADVGTFNLAMYGAKGRKVFVYGGAMLGNEVLNILTDYCPHIHQHY